MMDNHIVGTTHQHLGLAVAIPVVAHSIILLVRARHHVRSQVYPPQTVSLQRVALDAMVGRVVGHRRAVGPIVTLQQEFAHAIAIDIGQSNVIDIIVVGDIGAPT